MKKLLLFAIIFTGCIETNEDKFDRFMTELECPVILISKTDAAVPVPSISVRDGAGRVRTFSHMLGLSESVAASREVGDTLKPCN